MATRKNSKKEDSTAKRKKVKDWQSIQYVLNNLLEEHWAWLDQTKFDGERYSEFVEGMIDQGFSFKLDWDNYSECYQATATCMWEGFHNTGYAVSGRSEDIWDAQHILWFKMVEIAEWDLVAQAEEHPKRGKRG